MDFTISTCINLLSALIDQGFSFLSVEEFVSNPADKVIVLRHDVDSLPLNSLKFAKIQAEKGIKGTYYFRIVPQSFDEKTIKEIFSLGHEIGFHYEDVSLAAGVWRQAIGSERKTHDARHTEEELAKIAIESFKKNLDKLRIIVPVKTICMHGSPMSRWDSRLLWKYYDYHDFGIIGEPYFDVNFEGMIYLTDTGRKWDGGSVSIRDKGLGIRDEGNGENVYYKEWKEKPIKGSLMNMSQKSIDFQNSYKFRSTSDIIRAAERVELPDKMMMTFHPQRWTDKPGPWLKELVLQNVKNVGKYFLIKLRS